MGEASTNGAGAAQFMAEPVLDCEQIDGLVAAAGVDAAREILSAFWRSTDALLKSLQDQLSNGDLVEAARTAHALKGSSLNVGALRLSAAARAIEECCKRQDPQSALQRLCGAEAGYAETVAAFNAHLATAA